MSNFVSVQELEEKIRKIEHENSRWVVHYSITKEGGIAGIEFADIGPQDYYVINVRDCRAELCVQVARMKLQPVEYHIPKEKREEYEKWLYDNLEKQDAPVNISGIRKVVLPVPDFVNEAVEAMFPVSEELIFPED